MYDKEVGKRNNTSKCTCPSFTMCMVYTSIVVVVVGIIVPFELHFGLVKLVRHIDQKLIINDTNLVGLALNKLGYSISSIDGEETKKELVLTKEDLKMFSGDSNVLYLAILGKVYNVTKGRQHYGKGGSYSFFTGKDSSRAFVTGDFKEAGLTDNIENLPPKDYVGLFEWMKFYEKDYQYVGKVEGYFYDKQGQDLDGVKVFEEGYKQGLALKAEEEDDKNLFPDCNSKWTKEEGTTLYCSENSGGIRRDWIGVPRQYFKVGATKHRCACVQNKLLPDPRFKEYENCLPDSISCKL